MELKKLRLKIKIIQKSRRLTFVFGLFLFYRFNDLLITLLFVGVSVKSY